MVSPTENVHGWTGVVREIHGGGAQRQRLDSANTDFEAVLLRQLVVAMRKTIPQSSSSLFGSGSSKMYEHFIEDGLSRHLAEVGGIGLSEMLELKKNALTSTGSESEPEKDRAPVKSPQSLTVVPDGGAV